MTNWRDRTRRTLRRPPEAGVPKPREDGWTWHQARCLRCDYVSPWQVWYVQSLDLITEHLDREHSELPVSVSNVVTTRKVVA